MDFYGRRDIKRGDIYYINNNRGQVGSEMKKDRPAIIVSNDISNRYSNEVTVVFLTSQPKKDMTTHVTILSTGRESIALCEAPTTLDKQRVNNYLGHVSRREMEAVDEGLLKHLGLFDKNSCGGGDTGQQNDQGRSCGSWEKKANEAEIKAETYKAMYSELLEKIIQGGQNND